MDYEDFSIEDVPVRTLFYVDYRCYDLIATQERVRMMKEAGMIDFILFKEWQRFLKKTMYEREVDLKLIISDVISLDGEEREITIQIWFIKYGVHA